MHDGIQQAIQALAYQDTLTRAVAVFLAAVVVYLMGLVWLAAVYYQRATITLALAVRVVLLFVVSYVAAKVFGHIVADPRPYLVEQITPLMTLSHDNGFPSDHTLLAAALTVSLVWFALRLVPPFVVGTLLVMLGRLGVAAHHTEDVVGSVVIVVVVAVLLSALPLPTAWRRPLLERSPRLSTESR